MEKGLRPPRRQLRRQPAWAKAFRFQNSFSLQLPKSAIDQAKPKLDKFAGTTDGTTAAVPRPAQQGKKSLFGKAQARFNPAKILVSAAGA